MAKSRNKYFKDLHQQAYEKLTSMQAFGESKKEAMANGTEEDKIFSYNTYKTYWKHIKYFIKHVQEVDPTCTSLKHAKKHVNTWLQSRVDQGLSAWTVQTEAKALGKLFGIKPEDKDYFEPPKRNRADIKRSRVSTERDKHFSVTNNDELIKFSKGTGLRRSELEALKGSDVVTKAQIEQRIALLEQKSEKGMSAAELKELGILKDAAVFEVDHYVIVRSGKGGRARISPVIGPNTAQIVERIQNTGKNENVWQHVNSNADIHGYRGDYATMIYKKYAREIKDIPYDRVNKGTGKRFQSEVYTCRKDEAGKKLDKKAMLMASKALGHNRIEVVANNYIRGL